MQTGHDDMGVPASTEKQRVTQAVHLIRTQAPGATWIAAHAATDLAAHGIHPGPSASSPVICEHA